MMVHMSIFQMSITASVLVLAVVVIRSFALNKLPKIVFMILWIMLLFCLLIAFYIFGLGSASLAAIIVWIIGAFALAFFFIYTHFRYLIEYRASLPVDSDIVNEWLKEQKLTRPIQIRLSDRVTTPLTYGILKPVILLPKVLDLQDEITLLYVLTHELIHIKRFDILAKWLLVLVLCLHWFNPLVWVMYVFVNRDIELSCDEAVVKIFSKTKSPSYALALKNLKEKEVAPMFNIQTTERCMLEYCRKFLKEDEKMIGICRDCAELSVMRYRKMFRVRSIIGGLIISFVLLLIPLLNHILGLNDVIVIPFHLPLSISIWSFNTINSIGFIGVIGLITLCYFLAFAGKVKFENIFGFFQQKLNSRGHDIGASAQALQVNGTVGRFGASPDVYGRVGITIIELFISFMSGPFFFVHGVYKYRQLAAYIIEDGSK